MARARASVDELASQQGVTPIHSVSDLRFNFLNSEAELEEFLSAVKAGRDEESVRDSLNDG